MTWFTKEEKFNLDLQMELDRLEREYTDEELQDMELELLEELNNDILDELL